MNLHGPPFLAALLMTTSLTSAQTAETRQVEPEVSSAISFTGGGRTDRVNLPHANAVRWEDCPDRYGVTVYLTSHPIDVETFAQGEGDPDTIIRTIERELHAGAATLLSAGS